eukprot:351868-Chlamydomonas_euryale.AAC.2
MLPSGSASARAALRAGARRLQATGLPAWGGLGVENTVQTPAHAASQCAVGSVPEGGLATDLLMPPLAPLAAAATASAPARHGLQRRRPPLVWCGMELRAAAVRAFASCAPSAAAASEHGRHAFKELHSAALATPATAAGLHITCAHTMRASEGGAAAHDAGGVPGTGIAHAAAGCAGCSSPTMPTLSSMSGSPLRQPSPWSVPAPTACAQLTTSAAAPTVASCAAAASATASATAAAGASWPSMESLGMPPPTPGPLTPAALWPLIEPPTRRRWSGGGGDRLARARREFARLAYEHVRTPTSALML